MVQSYIRKRGITGSDGRQLNINIDSIRRTKGTPPNRINIPGLEAASQISAPILGQQDGFDVVIRLTEQTSNVGFDVDSAGSTSAHTPSILTIEDQYNFLYDEVVNNSITAAYEIFLDWINVTFQGTVLIDDQVITNLKYKQEILVVIKIDRGQNPFYNRLV